MKVYGRLRKSESCDSLIIKQLPTQDIAYNTDNKGKLFPAEAGQVVTPARTTGHFEKFIHTGCRSVGRVFARSRVQKMRHGV